MRKVKASEKIAYRSTFLYFAEFEVETRRSNRQKNFSLIITKTFEYFFSDGKSESNFGFSTR